MFFGDVFRKRENGCVSPNPMTVKTCLCMDTEIA